MPEPASEAAAGSEAHPPGGPHFVPHAAGEAVAQRLAGRLGQGIQLRHDPGVFPADVGGLRRVGVKVVQRGGHRGERVRARIPVVPGLYTDV